MKNTHNPSRLLWFVTLPQTLLAVGLIALLAGRVHTGALWVLIISAVVNIVFTGYAILRRKQPAVNNVVWIALTIASCVLLSASALLLDGAKLFGLSLRLTALLLNAITALFAVAAFAKSLKLQTDAGRHVIALVALPFAWFFVFNIATGIRLETAAIILIVAGALATVFLLIRIASAHGSNVLSASGVQKTSSFVLFLIFSIVLPFIGLSLNTSLSNTFGDFSDPWFFVIPILNGVLLLLPPFTDKRIRLLRFILLSAFLVYFVYFFVVFIPYLPVGFYGLMFGVGVLIFAPVGALMMQIVELNCERKQLLPLWGGARLTLAFILALLLIPVCMLTGIIGDRRNLDNAISYLETGEAPSGVSVDVGRLKRTLDNASATFEISRSLLTDFESANNTPLLSAAYSAMVLNGKVMKESEIEHLHRLYFDQSDTTESVTNGLTVNGNNKTDVRLTEVATRTTYDTEIGACRTWVDLTLKGGKSKSEDEYITLFTLPDGAYISDYYLDVGAERKYGILVDERAAMSVYENIVRIRRDPGVIHYISDRQLELRVFPFSIDEIRHTGFEIIHSQSFNFMLDDRTITLDATNTTEEILFQGGALISGALKRTLPKAGVRKPSYYFVIDGSAHSLLDYQIALIKDYASINGIDDAQIIFASYNLAEVPLQDAQNLSVTPRCGFNLALAIKKILKENGDGTVPLILFTSSNPAGAILPEHSSWLAKRFPDSPYYYRLRDDLMLIPYTFDGNRVETPVVEPVIVPLRLYQDSYVQDNAQSEIVNRPDSGNFAITDSQYSDALALDTSLRSQPSTDTGTSLTMLRASFRSHVLTRQSAFIVVETPEQEAELWAAQELLLEQDSAMARETLDEPPMILVIILFAGVVGAYLLIRRRKRLYL